MKPAQLSVVIPAYNEEKVIATSLARVAAYLESAEEPELIVVDDGSRDRTPQIVRELEGRYPFLRLIINDRNGGKGLAVRRGVLASRGRWVVYTDADLVYPIDGVEPFVEALESVGGLITPMGLRAVFGDGASDLARLPESSASSVRADPQRLFAAVVEVLRRLAPTSPVLLLR